jgi:hypothetical protein
MNMPPSALFRFAALLLAALLGAQCIWLVLPELSRSDVHRLPTDAVSAGTAAKQRGAAAWAASFGVLRGDLWAESSFTHADLMWNDATTGTSTIQSLQSARENLDYALREAPEQSDAWLLLAGLASRYPSVNSNALPALKMSYYTGPSEHRLMPLRLLLAAQSDVYNDAEMRDFMSRDLRYFLSQKQRSVIEAAFGAASGAGKSFIEQVVSDLDPSARQWLRGGQSIPN